ncbi:MAG: cobalamin biosynthesis protein CobD [Spirochaetae bacterium HGW-Spirochaetae-5]|nr:MAG: cobalamin biosynthesis protein CobD [Spirochaetae bacterium HGW-Spirochaetae-5]
MILSVKITIGFFLDFILGDPRRFPHPVSLIGGLISRLEKILRRGVFEKGAGVILVVIVVPSVYFIVMYISALSWALEIFLIYTIFALKSLSTEALKVYKALADGNIELARKEISFLVSRDTASMKRSDIIRAAVETVTENIVDGVTAPMFYLFIGGAPAGMAYKAANTIDSMIGYKNEKYIKFGWSGARLDDLLNYIPARITGFVLIPLAALFTGGSVTGAYRILLRDRLNHSSPNSGHPESASAGALGIQLGGPVSYFGVMNNKPYIGDKERELELEDIRRAIRLLYAVSFIAMGFGWVIFLTVKFFI